MCAPPRGLRARTFTARWFVIRADSWTCPPRLAADNAADSPLSTAGEAAARGPCAAPGTADGPRASTGAFTREVIPVKFPEVNRRRCLTRLLATVEEQLKHVMDSRYICRPVRTRGVKPDVVYVEL